MNYLRTNTSGQKLYLSLFEGRYTLSDFSHYMISIIHEENSNVGNSLNQVATIVTESERYTEIEVSTIGLTLSGRYRYIVYGQNSDTNTNATDASVVGQVEIGYIELTNDTQYFNATQTTIENDIIIGS